MIEIDMLTVILLLLR